MEVYLGSQLTLFLFSFSLGMALAIIYDIFRVIRVKFSLLPPFIILCDALFLLLALSIIFLFVFMKNSGEMRSYIYLAMAIGAAVYFVTLSKIFVPVLGFLVGMIIKIFTFIFRILSRVAGFLIKVISFPFKKLWAGALALGRALRRKIKQRAAPKKKRRVKPRIFTNIKGKIKKKSKKTLAKNQDSI